MCRWSSRLHALRMSGWHSMLVGLIAGRSIDGTDLAFPGESFLQMVAHLVAFEPSLGTTADGERAGHGDEQQNALHPLILRSERSIAIADCETQTDRINGIYWDWI